jgi:hypothetical protein
MRALWLVSQPQTGFANNVKVRPERALYLMIPSGDLVSSGVFRTHGNVTTTTPIPIPAGDHVSSRGFRTHGNVTTPIPIPAGDHVSFRVRNPRLLTRSPAGIEHPMKWMLMRIELVATSNTEFYLPWRIERR